MNKLILSFTVLLMLNVVLPPQYSTVANAGAITWGAKKLVGGTIKLIFKVSSEKIIEIQIEKLIHFLQKNPKYKQFAIDKINEQINKYPKYKTKGYMLLNKISKLVNEKVKIK